MAEISKQYRLGHENLLDLVGGLTDEQIGWISGKTSPYVGFMSGTRRVGLIIFKR